MAALISLIREVRAASLRSINNDRSRSPAEELRQQEVEAEAGYEVVGLDQQIRRCGCHKERKPGISRVL